MITLLVSAETDGITGFLISNLHFSKSGGEETSGSWGPGTGLPVLVSSLCYHKLDTGLEICTASSSCCRKPISQAISVRQGHSEIIAKRDETCHFIIYLGTDRNTATAKTSQNTEHHPSLTNRGFCHFFTKDSLHLTSLWMRCTEIPNHKTALTS